MDKKKATGKTSGTKPPADAAHPAAVDGGFLFRHVGVMLFLCRRGTIVGLNPEAWRTLGLASAEQAIGRPFTDFLDTDFTFGAEDVLTLLSEEPPRFPLTLIPPDGPRLRTEVTVTPIPGADGPDFMVEADDISNRTRQAEALLTGEKRFRAMVDNAFHLYLVCERGQISYINAAGLKLLGAASAAEVVGGSLADYLHAEYRDLLLSGLDELLRTPEALPLKIRDLKGRLRDVQMAFIPLADRRSGTYMVEARDITSHNRAVAALRDSIDNLERRVAERTAELTHEIAERRKAEMRVLHQATHDSLTDLPNRVLFFQHLSSEMQDAIRGRQRLGLMYIDLDGFKQVNDNLGHGAGDDLLIEAATRLRSCLRPRDTLARMGGDEFCVLMPDVADRDDIAAQARAMLRVLGAPFHLVAGTGNIGASIGAVLFPDDGIGQEELLRYADVAMYQAKNKGKGVIQFFTEDLRQQTAESLVLSQGLRRAVEAGEFSIAYLPRWRIADRRIQGLEALLRWFSPSLGDIAPSRFVPLLEENGLISSVGDWLLQTIGRHRAEWRNDGIEGFRIGINLSARQARAADFVRRFLAALDAGGLTPTDIEIDIVESNVLSDGDRTLTALRALHDSGARITLDDFGTGFTSLNALRRLPIDNIKIDRSFIATLASDAEDRTLVKTIIAMAHSLGRNVIAEGVETQQQLQILKDLGCEEAQGYFLAPPLGKDAVTSLIKTHGHIRRL